MDLIVKPLSLEFPVILHAMLRNSSENWVHKDFGQDVPSFYLFLLFKSVFS